MSPSLVRAALFLPSGTSSTPNRPAPIDSISERQRARSLSSSDSNCSSRVSGSLAEPILETTKLFELWSKSSASPTMNVRAWKMFDLDFELDRRQREDWKGFHIGTMFKHGTKITLHGQTHSVISAPNTVQVTWGPDDSLVVQVRCLVPGYRREDTSSPLGQHLRDLLFSQNSAMTLYNGNLDVGIRLATFDVLDATVDTTLAFLGVVREKAAWRHRGFLDSSQIVEKAPMPSDLERIADYARTVRDLTQAIDLNTASIRLYSSSIDNEKLISLENLILRSTMRCERLRHLLADVQDRVEAFTTQAEKITAQSEQATIKLLTFISAIFLPLTAACSLLSMSNRVTAIGAIWWDWLCIVAVISFVVVQGYRLTLGAHNLGREPLVRRLAQLYRKARKETLEAHDMKEKHHVLPALPRNLYTVNKLILPLAIAAALLVGVFLNVSLGAQILAYSIAGAVGLMAGGVLLWRIRQFVLMLWACCVMAWVALKLFRDSRNRPRSQTSNAKQKISARSCFSLLKAAIKTIFGLWVWCMQCCCLTSVDDEHSEKRPGNRSAGASTSRESGPQE